MYAKSLTAALVNRCMETVADRARDHARASLVIVAFGVFALVYTAFIVSIVILGLPLVGF